ncbi:unnamed protein product [Spirodela intermedia]|uniref:Uncharacterized protein n=1 Tax=Spirodela intermedia TaxID=51605 RepID=A0A7I8JMX3_SPIIN|nr:unnamed protein product [Spirodela intermedia]CAA6671496.1 unnamed protein product [Spirodela intermedia]
MCPPTAHVVHAPPDDSASPSTLAAAAPPREPRSAPCGGDSADARTARSMESSTASNLINCFSILS